MRSSRPSAPAGRGTAALVVPAGTIALVVPTGAIALVLLVLVGMWPRPATATTNIPRSEAAAQLGPGFEILGHAAGQLRDLDVQADLAYVAWSGDLRVLSGVTSGGLTELARLPLGLAAYQVTTVGDRVYVAGLEDLYVVDVSEPAAPVLVGVTSLGPLATEMLTDGDRLFVLGRSGAVTVVDLSDPLRPFELGDIAAEPPATAFNDIAVADGFLFGATVAGVAVYRTADAPDARPVVVAPGSAVAVAADGATVSTLGPNGAFTAFTRTDSGALTSLGTASVPASVVGLHASDRDAGGPEAGGPHAGGPEADGPHAGGPDAVGPHADGSRFLAFSRTAVTEVSVTGTGPVVGDTLTLDPAGDSAPDSRWLTMAGQGDGVLHLTSSRGLSNGLPTQADDALLMPVEHHDLPHDVALRPPGAVGPERAYVANLHSGVAVVDVSDPWQPQILERKSHVLGETRGVVAAGGRLFAFLWQPNCPCVGYLAEFDLSRPGLRMSLSPPRPRQPVDIEVYDHFLYLVDEAHAVDVVDIATEGQAVVAGQYEGSQAPVDMAIAGQTGVIADVRLGLQLVDLEVPWSPQLISEIALDPSTTAVAASEDLVHALVTTDAPGEVPEIVTLDIMAPANPVERGRLSVTGAAGVHAAGACAYVRTGESVRAYDFSDPTSPVLLDVITIPDLTDGFEVEDGVAYVTSSDLGLVTLTDPCGEGVPNPTPTQESPGDATPTPTGPPVGVVYLPVAANGAVP